MNLEKLSSDIYNKLKDGNNNNKLPSKLLLCRDILKSYDCDDWKKFIQFSNTNYSRIKLDEFSNDLFDVILICWNKGQSSRLHDHPENGCLLKILQGSLQEELHTFDDNKTEYIGTKIINVDDISYMEKSHKLHKISSLNEQAISLHIYSPPGYSPKCYGS